MVLYLLVIGASLLYFVLKLRYEFSYFPLFLIAAIQGQRFKVARTIEEVKKALMLSDKGRGIEELIAMPAWEPILSLESVNGSKWIELKKNFLILQKHLPSVQQLGIVAKHEMNKFIGNNQNTELNSKEISILALRVFVNWLFNNSETDADILTKNQLETIYESSMEYRKELAFKALGCKAKKQDSVDIIVDLLQNSEKYGNVFNDWKQPEYYSVIMQPFIISPMINVSDIAVTLKKDLTKFDSEFNNDTSSFVDYAIASQHPFPILERYNQNTNTQTVIILSDFKGEEKFNYGHGPRACLGRLYAREFLKEFFEPALINKSIQFLPEKLHFYSGRNNDNGNIQESIYQLKSLAKILYFLIMEKFSFQFKSKSIENDAH